MRLLNTQTLKLEEFYEDIPDYAILSHRWGKDEVTFQDVPSGRAMTKKGWHKVVNCCSMAASRNLSYVWIDTCCIDKSSSAELSESINTMYAWYEQATECYAFLGDVHLSLRYSDAADLAREIADSVWFTRGWTLQELIAPRKLIFFNNKWEGLWTKSTHGRELQDITHISRRLLEGEASLADYSLAQRMAWAADRTTTRLEDAAYSLLGIFQVNMPMLYGEGKNAFRRLQEEIIKQSDDQTLFAWHDDRDIKPVLAPSASCFRSLYDLKCIYATNDSRFGHTLSNSGLNIKLMLIPWDMDVYVAPLSCGRALTKPSTTSELPTRGYSRMAIFVRRTKFEDHLVRVNGGGKDFVMLDSDVVAYKRDSFGIKDRQVFVRQSLVNLPDQVHHSFAFNYLNPQMFSNGQVPIPGEEVLNFFDRTFGTYHGVDHFYEPYSHYESVAFNIKNLSADKRSHFLHLGFDLDFAPVCLVTAEPWLADKKDRICERDFRGMFSLQSKQVSSLSWLLSQVKLGKTSTTILAFKAVPGASTEVRCTQLSLKIKFEVRCTAYNIEGLGHPGKMWHVTFEHFESIPTAPSILGVDHTPLQHTTHDVAVDGRLPLRATRGSTWLKYLTRMKIRSSKSTVKFNPWIKKFGPEGEHVSTDVKEVSEETCVSQLTTNDYIPWELHPYYPRAFPSLSQTPLVSVPTNAGSNSITAGLYQMGSDELQQATMANHGVVQIQVRRPAGSHGLNDNGLTPGSSLGLSTIDESEPSRALSGMMQTPPSSKSEIEWMAQRINDSQVSYEIPPSTVGSRVVEVTEELRSSHGGPFPAARVSGHVF